MGDPLQAADLLLLGGDVPEALEMLAQARAAASADPEPCFRMGEIRVRLGAPDDLRAALSDLDRALALGMDTSQLHFLRMRAAFELGDLVLALAAYGAALALAPADIRLREWGVRLALAEGDPAQALALVRAERVQAPTAFHWARWEAELLLVAGEVRAACAAFDALIGQHCPPDLMPGSWAAPVWADVLLKRAEALDRLGEPAAARVARAEAARLTT